MDYRRFGDTLLVRIDRGEEILEQVKTVALKENIQLASVQALGALGSFTVGVYKIDEKKYYANSFEGSFEIVSLTGTIDTIKTFFGSSSGACPAVICTFLLSLAAADCFAAGFFAS